MSGYRLTFNTADPPQPGVGEITFLGFGLRLDVVRGCVGCVADVRPRIEPVVRADGDGHQAEGGESPHGGQQRLNPAVTPSHDASYYSPHSHRSGMQRAQDARQGAEPLVILVQVRPLSLLICLKVECVAHK